VIDEGRTAMKISRVDTPKCQVGECPIWDVAEQALYFIDIFGRKIHRYDPAAGATRSWDVPQPGALAIREQGGAVYASGTAIHALDFDSGASTMLADSGKGERPHFNDGKTDRRGRFVLGLGDTDFADTQPVGGLYGFGADHKLVELDRGVHFSNSHCFSPDGGTLYCSDSFLHTTYAYDYDLETGQVGNKRVFVDTRELGGMPDGATVDSEGLVWMAIYQGGKLVAFRPDGRIERIIDMPVSLPASVMFGGPDLDQLYVVTIDPACFGQPAEEGAGCTYLIEGLGVRGVPEPRYRG
jgi:sugar lactone lactonase YvrE